MTNKNFATAGNLGKGVRSDCKISLELTDGKGINIEIISKVKEMYGESIEKDIKAVLNKFNIENANVKIEDSGALSFVIAARMEAAIKQLIDTKDEFLPELIPENNYSTKRDLFRFSRLYLPGNNPKMMLNAGIHNPDGIILDLEDSVSVDKKHEARFLVRNALRSINFYGAEKMVRINQGERGIEDLDYVIPHKVNLLLLPKCESAEDVKKVDERVKQIKKEKNLDYPVYYMPIVESAMGVEKAFEIATASKNVVSMAIGLEDFTADLGVSRTQSAKESLYARTRLVNACKAAKIQPIDSVYSDVGNEEGLIETVNESKTLGFEGMGCIHPRQIALIHKAFAPEEDRIAKAKKIVLAFKEAEEKGLGVVSLGTKMIDPPVVKRAEKTIELAVSLGILEKDWMAKEKE